MSDPVLGDASEFCATEQPATFRGYTLAEAVKVAADAQVYPAAALEAARRREGHLTALIADAQRDGVNAPAALAARLTALRLLARRTFKPRGHWRTGPADAASTALADNIAASLREDFAEKLPAMTVIHANSVRRTDGSARVSVTIEASAELMALIEASIAKGKTGPG